MDWNGYIDNYCERLGPGLLAEPVNAVTNVAFFIAAAYGLRLALAARDAGGIVLAMVAAAVGLGSLLFHTTATRWALYADVTPITLFILIGLGLVLRRRVGLPPLVAAGAALLFVAVSPALAAPFVRLIGSSAGYVPPLLALVLIGGGLVLAHRPGGRTLLAAGGVFTLSLTLRTLDQPLCSAFPIGTHGGWHLLNAVVLGLVMRAVSGRVAAPGRLAPQR